MTRTASLSRQHNILEGIGETYNASISQGGQRTQSRTGTNSLKALYYVLTDLSYTVLVRRYQNQGIFLPSRGSSPSDSSTPAPLSSYALEDEYSYDASSSYNNTLMSPQHHGTSAGSHRSWSSLDSEAAISAWSHAPSYSLPIISPTPNITSQPLPDYALAPHPHAPTQWDWPANAMHARSPISYTTPPAPQHYDDSALHPALAARSHARASYPGVLPNAVPPSNLPKARAWSEQQSYDSLAAATYEDPGLLQQNPLYRF